MAMLWHCRQVPVSWVGSGVMGMVERRWYEVCRVPVALIRTSGVNPCQWRQELPMARLGIGAGAKRRRVDASGPRQ